MQRIEWFHYNFIIFFYCLAIKIANLYPSIQLCGTIYIYIYIYVETSSLLKYNYNINNNYNNNQINYIIWHQNVITC